MENSRPYSKTATITNYEIFLKLSRCLGVFDFSALFKF